MAFSSSLDKDQQAVNLLKAIYDILYKIGEVGIPTIKHQFNCEFEYYFGRSKGHAENIKNEMKSLASLQLIPDRFQKNITLDINELPQFEDDTKQMLQKNKISSEQKREEIIALRKSATTKIKNELSDLIKQINDYIILLSSLTTDVTDEEKLNAQQDKTTARHESFIELAISSTPFELSQSAAKTRCYADFHQSTKPPEMKTPQIVESDSRSSQMRFGHYYDD